MNNFDVTILTPQGDNRVKLIPGVNNVVLETSQSYPGFYKNIEFELSNEDLEQLRAWLDCYFKEREEDKKNQKLTSCHMDEYDIYIEALVDSKTINSEIPKNTIEYFSNLKNYLDFSILAPQLYASHRHTVLMKFFKVSKRAIHKLTLEFLVTGNLVNTILYKIESRNEDTNRYEFTDEGLKAILSDTTGLVEDINFKLCAKAIKDIYNEFMETDYE